MRVLSFSLLALLLAPALCAQKAPSRPALGALDPEILKGHLYYIASDTLGGRATPSEGLDLAADYIAANMRRLGLEPAAPDGSYFQEIEMVAERQVLQLLGEGLGAGLEPGTHWRSFGAPFEGELVFCGYGLVEEQKSWDELAGLDLKGKVAVVLEGRPTHLDEPSGEGRQRRRFTRNYAAALRAGASGVLLLTERAGSPSRPRYRVKSGSSRRRRGGSRSPVYMTREGSAALGQALGVDFSALRAAIGASEKPRSRALPGKVKLATDGELTTTTRNVVAVLPATEPALRGEYVAFGAHYDHVGMRAGVEGDGIYNGADDDGSGTVALIVLAEAFTKVAERKRSLLFVWHCGEERGMVGSSYYVNNPLRPLEDTVCLFNIDMIGRNYRDDPERANHVFLVGARKISTELGDIITAVNQRDTHLELDESDPSNYYQRSDHICYARKGVPIAFFITGEHGDYHGAGDHADKILYDKMARITRLIFESALEVTNRPARLNKDALKGARGDSS